MSAINAALATQSETVLAASALFERILIERYDGDSGRLTAEDTIKLALFCVEQAKRAGYREPPRRMTAAEEAAANARGTELALAARPILVGDKVRLGLVELDHNGEYHLIPADIVRRPQTETSVVVELESEDPDTKLRLCDDDEWWVSRADLVRVKEST